MALKISVPPIPLQPIPLKQPEVKTGVDYSSHFKSKPITGSVTTGKKIKNVEQATEISESETLHTGVFTDGTLITVEGGMTLNLGNYESARIGVSLTMPCSGETMNEAYEFATEWVSQKIQEAVKKAKIA